MGQKRSYTQYPTEFKEEAVALIRDQGYSVSDAAKSLGITTSLLYRWKDQHEQILCQEINRPSYNAFIKKTKNYVWSERF
jgi:transposase